MRTGPDLDAEIVKTLWGYLVMLDVETGSYTMMSAFGKEAVPPYSSCKEAVTQVTEHYRGLGWRLRSRKDGKGYVAAFVRNDGAQYRFIFAETLAEAICRAALAVATGTNIQAK